MDKSLHTVNLMSRFVLVISIFLHFFIFFYIMLFQVLYSYGIGFGYIFIVLAVTGSLQNGFTFYRQVSIILIIGELTVFICFLYDHLKNRHNRLFKKMFPFSLFHFFYMIQNPMETYGYSLIFSLTGYLGITFVLTFIRIFGALMTVTGKLILILEFYVFVVDIIN